MRPAASSGDREPWTGLRPDHPAYLIHTSGTTGTPKRVLVGHHGVPGPHEVLNSRGIDGDPLRLADRMLVGGTMESIVHNCTAPLAAALAARQIPATVHFHPGTHAWAYWQDDLHRSWPVFAGALGV